MIPISKPIIGQEEIDAVTQVLKSGIIAQGSKVSELETSFANLCGTSYASAVNNGTAALHAALKSIGVREGDEVITTPFTFIATANTILMQGARPVFADVEDDTFNIDPTKIEEQITSKTRAIVSVDLYGHLCDYASIEELAKQKKLSIVEDACQAVGANYNGKNAGSFGDAAAFSFYATKNITCGEGGMVTTSRKEVEERTKLFRQHGRKDLIGYEYSDLGYNYRMTDINAAILLAQLKKLKNFTEKRIKNAAYLSKGLKSIKGIKIPTVKKGHTHVYHQYTIQVGENFPLNRDELAAYLKKQGIGSGVYYPIPLHLCNHISKLGYKKSDFPVAEKLSKEVLSLPVHPSLNLEELDHIIKTIAERE
jgi:dTDP-4-amino-4,6-dideoxygalactose transaminase